MNIHFIIKKLPIPSDKNRLFAHHHFIQYKTNPVVFACFIQSLTLI